LIIGLPGSSDRVRIHYQTAPEASGLQWLEPAQTSGDSPFLYSQSQAIHARSWIPCQDSPTIRTPIQATVTVDRPLRALMGANDDGITTDREGTHYHFSLDQAIPSYLLAIAIGDLHKQELGPRTAVWAEPAVLPGAAQELAELETMLPAIEADFGPYRWGRYEVLILPPSFPFGGMENPIVTFATPTILAGDRSLVSLIAHELAHSWSGNLVTNATWDDLWLNEGPTTYLERRIIEALYGRERAEMEATLGKQLLLESLAEIPESEQSLRASEQGRDPDAVFSDVAYEKGALFFRLLEDTYGRERFDPFLRAWFDEHAFTSQTTATFVEFTRTRLIDAEAPLPGHQAPDLEDWIYGPGLPSDTPNPKAASFAAVEADAAAWIAGTIESPKLGETWSPLHWIHFIDQLPADMPAAQLANLDSHHELTASGNRELLAAWLDVSIRARYKGVEQRLRWFLTTIGRRKYLTTLYRALLETDGDSRRARSIYDEARPTYQAIARETIEAMLDAADKSP
ncbi:MAG TPA: aminopeptidase, partial [Nannocystis exedens]|nr:aminopeptidase [Nannocystis exedens]